MTLLALILAVATSATPTTAPSSPDLWTTHCLQNVFRDTPAPSAREPVQWAGARGQLVDAQIVLRSSDTPLSISGVTCSQLKQPRGATLAPATFDWHFIEYQPVKRNSSKTPPEELLRKAPADFPDAFSDAREMKVEPGQSQPLWVQLRVPESAAAGDYDGDITVTTSAGPLRTPLKLRVYDFTLPEPRLWVTVWIDAPGLAKHQHVEFASDAYWDLLDRTARIMHDHHQNVILTSWGLIKAQRDSAGALTFDFSKFDRWVELFLHNGFKRIELTHVGGREHGQWEDKNFIPVPFTFQHDGKTEKLQLEQWLPPLEAHLREKKWIDLTLLHVADEPTAVNVASWIELSRRVHKSAPSLRRIDAIQTPDITAADLEVPVPALDCLQRWEKQYDAAQKKGVELWYYTAWVPQEHYPNRMMDYPLLKTRVLHWLNFTTGATGYLHWGLNQWDVPFDTFAPGDNWIIWPGKTGPRSSIRYEAMRAGIEDYEYLKLLEDRAAAAAQRLALKDFDAHAYALTYARRAADSFQTFSRDPQLMLKTRDAIARAIEKITHGEPPPAID